MLDSRILVLYSKSLFSQGVEKLLEGIDGAMVSALDLDQKDIDKQIRAYDPEVVIVDSFDLNTYGKDLIMKIFAKGISAKIICLNMSNDMIEVYDKHLVSVKGANELVEVISH